MTKELVQLLVVPDGELKVARDDTLLLVIAGSVTGEFKNFSRKVFKNCGEVDYTKHLVMLYAQNLTKDLTWCTSSDTLSIVSLLQ